MPRLKRHVAIGTTAMRIPGPGDWESKPVTRNEARDVGETLARGDDGSILVIGDDPLFVRALDRVLRGAGYTVGIGDQSVDDSANRPLGDGPSPAALTIIDVPDDWTRHGRPRAARLAQGRQSSDRTLWISNVSEIVDTPERCLVKPFTASQLLAKVETLVNNRTERDPR